MKRSGVISKKDYIVQTIPLRTIRSIETQRDKVLFLGARTPILIVLVDPSKVSGIPRHEFGVAAPEQWEYAIRIAMEAEALREIESRQSTYVKEVVREVVKYPCPYCRTLIEVTSERCPSCGAPQAK